MNPNSVLSSQSVNRLMGFRWLSVLLLLALCALLFFSQLGRTAFWDRGESREGLVVWEMYTSGNWILPKVNNDYIPFKPPLFHWVGVLAAKGLGGVDEFTIRFPSALFGTLGVLLTYLAGARLWGEKAGIIAAVVLATSHEWWQAATIAQVDMTLAFFLVAAFLLFFFVYRDRETGIGKALILALLLALATLAKGPLGIVVPSLAFLIFLSLRRDLLFLKKLHPFAGAALFLVVAGSWYGLATWQGGEPFLRRQILEETVLTATGGYGHHQPLYYFVPIFFLNMAPWSFFFPALVLFLYQQRSRLAEDGLFYLLVWFTTVFLFFSMASGKRGIYILSLYPATALVFSVWWVQLEKGAAGGLWFVHLVGYLIAGLYLLLFAGMLAHWLGWGGLDGYLLHFASKSRNPSPILSSALHFLSQPPSWVWACLVLLCLAALALILSLWRSSWSWAFVALTLLTATTAFLIKGTYYPWIAGERTLKPFMERVRQDVNIKAPLFFYNSFDYGALFYARRQVTSHPENGQPSQPPVFFLMWEDEWNRLHGDGGLKMLEKSEGTGPVGKHHMVLVEATENLPNSQK